MLEQRITRRQLPMNAPRPSSAAVVTIYYWWQNIKGIEESSDKALEVMKITTIMVVILLGWGIFSASSRGRTIAAAAHAVEPALLQRRARLPRAAPSSLRSLGLFGILMAFGHSVLAMSGEESLAQVNREIEHPKLKNLKRAAIVIAIYSLVFTGDASRCSPSC